MNDDPAPLEPGELDDLISADLDGELAAAARDHGSDVDTIRARIAATPKASQRRAALVAARELLAEPPELDDLVAARLRAKAVRVAETDGQARATARRARRNRRLLAVSGIAASILVVAAIAVAAGRSGSSSSSDASSSSGNAAATTPPASVPRTDLTRPVPALGSYTDAAALGSVAVNVANQRAVGKLALGSAEKRAASGNTTANPPALDAGQLPLATTTHGGTSNDSLQFGGSDRSAQSAAGTAKRNRAIPGSTQCSAAKFAGPGDQLSLHASATLDGQPVQVYVFAGHGEHTVVVLGRTCELVNHQTVG